MSKSQPLLQVVVQSTPKCYKHSRINAVAKCYKCNKLCCLNCVFDYSDRRVSIKLCEKCLRNLKDRSCYVGVTMFILFVIISVALYFWAQSLNNSA